MKQLHNLVKVTDAHTAMIAAIQEQAEQLRQQAEDERQARIDEAATSQPTPGVPADGQGQAAAGA